MLVRVLAAVALLAAVGCGDNTGQSFNLSDGSSVFVGSDGDFEIHANGQTIWASGRDRPTTSVFDLEIVADLGIWDFRRSSSEETAYALASAERDGDAVVLDYGGATIRIEPGAANRTRLSASFDGDPSAVAIPLRCDAESSFLGFGEQYNATDQRGEAFDVWVSEQGIGREGGPRIITGDAHTTYFAMPQFIDARGFGALIETTYPVRVDLCSSNPNTAWFEVVGQDHIELVLFHGPEPLDVVRQLSDHLGRNKAPPDWALGVWIGAQGGTDAINQIAGEIEAAQIPATALWVQDWTGVRGNIGGGFGVEYRWEVDDSHYPNLAAQITSLRTRGLRFLAYANSFIDPDLDNHFAEMEAADLLIKNEDGETYLFGAPNGLSSLPDLTNPAARDYVKDALRAMVTDVGVDGWMSDFGEWLPTDAVLSDGTSALAYHNQFPVEWQKLWREVMDELRPDGDFAVFARSGFTGVQAAAQIYWIGDQETSFAIGDGLPTVPAAMINLGLSGIGVATHDIAGFSSLDLPSDKELYLRWTEIGAFSPVMRTHEGNARDENWNWNRDAETLAHFTRFARVHQALVPELAELALEFEQTGVPIVRHLILHYPDDLRLRGISDQFLLGPDLLVAPILARGASSRDVVLPDGAWFHIWSGDRHEGGQTIQIEAPIGEPPVFSRSVDRPQLRAIR